MPLSVVPTNVNEPSPSKAPAETAPAENATPDSQENGASANPDQSPNGNGRPASSRVSTSRWIDYDTYELLDMISELEDERRWARLREGALWAVLLHALLLLGVFMLPKYIFVPRVITPQVTTKDREWTYLDSPRIPVTPPTQKPLVNPPKPPQIDKKTLEALNKAMPQLPPAPAPKVEQVPAPAPPPPPKPESQPKLESPVPQPAPQRPSFAMGSQNPADQLRDAMRNSRGPGSGSDNVPNSPGMAMHPGAGGGVEVLSDTQGVDFSPWLHRWYFETEHTWDPLIPDEVNAPILKQGQCMIRFKVLPNGRIMDGSMILEGRSGDTALDRAAWGALTGSNYPPLPREFHGPYLELRAVFMYNLRPPQ